MVLIMGRMDELARDIARQNTDAAVAIAKLDTRISNVESVLTTKLSIETADERLRTLNTRLAGIDKAVSKIESDQKAHTDEDKANPPLAKTLKDLGKTLSDLRVAGGLAVALVLGGWGVRYWLQTAHEAAKPPSPSKTSNATSAKDKPSGLMLLDP